MSAQPAFPTLPTQALFGSAPLAPYADHEPADTEYTLMEAAARAGNSASLRAGPLRGSFSWLRFPGRPSPIARSLAVYAAILGDVVRADVPYTLVPEAGAAVAPCAVGLAPSQGEDEV